MARAPWQYMGTIRHAVHQFKYFRRLRLGRWFVDDMAFLASRTLPINTITMMLSVPPFWMKHWFRGFNPADYLARQLASHLIKPYTPAALSRKHWTKPQTKLGFHQRADNVNGAFKANRSLVEGSNILLIDDVITSGATANACAQTLKSAGADKIYVLAAARTPLA